MSNPYRDKLLSIGFARGRASSREYRDAAGKPVKEVTDEAGNVLTWRDGNDAPHVDIRPDTITLADGRVLRHREG